MRHRGNLREDRAGNKRARLGDDGSRNSSRNGGRLAEPQVRPGAEALVSYDQPSLTGQTPHDARTPRPLGQTPRERSRPSTRGSNHDSTPRRTSRPPRNDALTEEEEEAKKFLDRQQKVEKWKASLAAKAAAKGTSSVASSSDPAKDEDSHTPIETYFANKFDPKAIIKRAGIKKDGSEAMLGGNIDIPKSGNGFSDLNNPRQAESRKGTHASKVNGEPVRRQNGVSTLLMRPSETAKATKITGFGLNRATAEKSGRFAAATTGTAALDADADEGGLHRKLEKLPDMPIDTEMPDDTLADDAEDADDDNDLRSDEDEAEAAREAAQRRAQEVQSAGEPTVPVDIIMQGKAQEEEEVDPLDAFMDNLEAPVEVDVLTAKGERQMFNSDDEGDIDAVGDGLNDLSKMKAKRKKKEIQVTDHSKIEYEPFRKEFYSESVELTDMTPEEVEVLRADLDNIGTKGNNPPKPITKFSQGGFGASILDVIRAQKFEKPTAIQSQALPAIMSGRDTVGIAKTGSGKTLAFILPMFRHIKDQRPLQNLDGPIGLVIAPTRELATQIHKECKPYLQALNLRAVCAYGGAPIKDQIAELKRGAEIVVCTAGRLIDLLAANSGRVLNLRRVTYIVLDEADRMFDMGFEPQITKILGNIRRDRQTVLFSATFPKNMDYLVRKHLKDALVIEVGGRSVVAPEIEQIIEVREENTRFKRLLQLLGDLQHNDEDARSLVFVERQETADSMLKELMKRQHICVSIHGGRDQIDRDQAISDFKAGHFPTMIATSVAARGLDVKQLKLVVNFDPPNHREDYVHRVGRTGRAGNTGTAVTFITPDQERYASFLIRALSDSKREVPEALTKLAESHQEKVKSGAAKKVGGGFGGRGIDRLDAARDADRKIERKLHKTGEEGDSESEEEDDTKKDKTKKIDEMMAKAISNVKDSNDAVAQPATAAVPNKLTALNAHLDNAMKVQKAERPAPVPKVGKVNDRLARAAAAAASISSRLGSKGTQDSSPLLSRRNQLTFSSGSTARPGAPPTDNRGPDAGAFHATLVINDFPQKARWAVTNRTNVAKILEATGTSITSKGVFYAEGKEPDEGGEPKLYILVEGDTEIVVEDAMRELTRLLREGLQAHLDQEVRAPTGGRYQVV